MLRWQCEIQSQKENGGELPNNICWNFKRMPFSDHLLYAQFHQICDFTQRSRLLTTKLSQCVENTLIKEVQKNECLYNKIPLAITKINGKKSSTSSKVAVICETTTEVTELSY